MKNLSVRLVLLLTILVVAALYNNACGKEQEEPPGENHLPVIASVSGDPNRVAPGGISTITCVAYDLDDDSLSYDWSATTGNLSGTGKVVTWTAPDVVGTHSISVTVNDSRSGTADGSCVITVTAITKEPNRPPVITSLTASPRAIEPGTSTTITCVATDPDGDQLIYRWFSPEGVRGHLEGPGTVVVLPSPNLVVEGTESFVTWIAPGMPGEYTIEVNVRDTRYGQASETVTITVAPDKPPVIHRLGVRPSTIIIDNSATITCVATDPEGVPLTYSWSATSGSISGTGDVITWTAPDYAVYATITVTVDDGRGGVATKSVTIDVRGRKITKVLVPVSSESGCIHSDGQIQAAWQAGDKYSNKGIRAFLSFPISKVTEVEEIRSAVLRITTRDQDGTPWAGLGTFYIDEVDYGDRPLEAADYDLPRDRRLASYAYPPMAEIDLTEIVKQAVSDGDPRFQITLYFQTETDNNDATDIIRATVAELIVDYVEKTW